MEYHLHYHLEISLFVKYVMANGEYILTKNEIKILLNQHTTYWTSDYFRWKVNFAIFVCAKITTGFMYEVIFSTEH